MNKIIALATLLIILGLVNVSIYHKERHLAQGAVVYLPLAPVDPRSLMQGDYMALAFEMERDIYAALPKDETSHRWRRDVIAEDGLAVVTLDERRVGSFATIYAQQPLSPQQILMRYRIRNGTVKFATNAFFFQEGTADTYARARFGEFRVDTDGELLLTALFNGELEKLQPDSSEQP